MDTHVAIHTHTAELSDKVVSNEQHVSVSRSQSFLSADRISNQSTNAVLPNSDSFRDRITNESTDIMLRNSESFPHFLNDGAVASDTDASQHHCPRLWVIVASVGFIVLAFCGGLSRVLHLAFAGNVGEAMESRIWGGVFNNSVAVGIHLITSFWGPPLKENYRDLKESIRLDKKILSTCFTGLCGGIALTCGVLVPKNVGFSLYFVILVSFQIIGSLLAESFGLGWLEKRKLNKVILTGGILVAAGTIVFTAESLFVETVISAATAWQVMFPAVAGVCSLMTTIGNKKLGAILRTPFRALVLSLSLSTSICFVAAMVISPWPKVSNLWKHRSVWQLAGGSFGAMTIFVQVVVPGRIGFAVCICFIILGQLTTSMLIDHFGLIGARRMSLSITKICGVAIVLLGVIAVRFTARIYLLLSRVEKMCCKKVIDNSLELETHSQTVEVTQSTT